MSFSWVWIVVLIVWFIMVRLVCRCRRRRQESARPKVAREPSTVAQRVQPIVHRVVTPVTYGIAAPVGIQPKQNMPAMHVHVNGPAQNQTNTNSNCASQNEPLIQAAPQAYAPSAPSAQFLARNVADSSIDERGEGQ